MTRRFDDIVLGLGGMGSAAAYHLARRGRRVLGLEQFDHLHERGSSHGFTRIIRLAYHEDPSYVPLLRRAYELWRELQARVEEELLVITGSLEVGPEDGPIFTGALEAARAHGLDHGVMDATEIEARFPGFRNLPPNYRGLWQPDGGFLRAERCTTAHVAQALAHGAELHFREPVRAWEAAADGGGVRVTTDAGDYEAERLVVCAGPWTARMIPAFAAAAVPERQVLIWAQPHVPEEFAIGRFPVFIVDVPDGMFYGFPVDDVPGMKLGLYHHLQEGIDPDGDDRSVRAEDEAALRAFLARHLPNANGPTVMLKACIFTNSPDEHFIIGPMPGSESIIVAAGFSGHGFKFCSVVGEILADLAMHGETSHDIGLFDPRRVLS